MHRGPLHEDDRDPGVENDDTRRSPDARERPETTLGTSLRGALRRGRPPGGAPANGRPPQYWAWLAAGFAAPFGLSALLYPFASAAVGVVSAPLAVLLAPLAEAAGRGADAPEALSGAYAAAPAIPLSAALSWAVAFLCARFLIERLAPRALRRTEPGHHFPDDAARADGRRGFAAGAKLALVVALVLLLWWAGGALLEWTAR